MQKLKTSIKNTLEKTLDIEIHRSKLSLKKPKSLIVNEAVNFEKEVIFIAIPKTCTTTVRTQIYQEGIPIIDNPHLNIIQIKDLIYIYIKKYSWDKQKFSKWEYRK